MRQDLRRGREFSDEIIAHDGRFQRTETDAFDPVHSGNLADQLRETAPVGPASLEIHAVRRRFDPREDDFAASGRSERFRFFKHGFRLLRADRSACLRNDAVRAAVFAAVAGTEPVTAAADGQGLARHDGFG